MWLLFSLFLALAVTSRRVSSQQLRRQHNSRPSTLISSAWYTGWHAADVPLDKVDWSQYTHMYYAFAITTPTASVITLEQPDQELLPQFVTAAHQHNVKAGLSIGGWTGSRYFSLNVGSSQNRTKFVKAVAQLAEEYNLDAVDFDWEYPGIQGIGCNVVNHNDTSNFLSFLKELRSNPTGKNLILSAAVYTSPFADATGQPSTNLAEFSQVLDHIAIMNYDTKSTPSTGAGPHAPLDDSCAPSGARFGSAVSAVKAWTDAGIPPHQIVLGVPAYGHSFNVPLSAAVSSSSTSDDSTPLRPYPLYDPNLESTGDRWDGEGGIDVCGNTEGPGGVYTYWGLIQEGLLNTDGTVARGINYRFDNCSQTPFLYDRSKKIYVSYDNPESFAAKGNFINTTGLAGFAMWEVGGDYKNVLLDSIVSAARKGDPSLYNPTSKSGTTDPTTSATSNAQPPPSVSASDLIAAVFVSLPMLYHILV